MGSFDPSFRMKMNVLADQEQAHLNELNRTCQHTGTIRQISQCSTVAIGTICSVCSICHLHVHTSKVV